MEDKKVLEFINENHDKCYKEFVKTQKRKNILDLMEILRCPISMEHSIRINRNMTLGEVR